jgi:hypothetical protein
MEPPGKQRALSQHLDARNCECATSKSILYMKNYILSGFVAVLLGGCTTYTTAGYGTRVYSDGYDSRGYHDSRYYGGGYSGGSYDERRYGYQGREVHNNVVVVQDRNAAVSHKTSTSVNRTTVSHVPNGHSTQAGRLSSPPKPHAESNKTAAVSHGVGKHPRSGKTEDPKKQ